MSKYYIAIIYAHVVSIVWMIKVGIKTSDGDQSCQIYTQEECSNPCLWYGYYPHLSNNETFACISVYQRSPYFVLPLSSLGFQVCLICLYIVTNQDKIKYLHYLINLLALSSGITVISYFDIFSLWPWYIDLIMVLPICTAMLVKINPETIIQDYELI